jgi:broad specificity phosphatase PhoE
MIDIHSRDADTPLSELGTRQSTALGQWFSSDAETLPPDVLLCSPFARARETVRIVAAELGIDDRKIRADERLREKEFGILDRYTRAGVSTKFPELAAQRALVGKFYFRPPGGESWCDVILRLRSVVEELRRDYSGDRVLIISHQVVVNCFRYLLEGMDEHTLLAIDRQGDVPNCSVTEYGFVTSPAGERFALLRANFIAPLIETGTPVTAAPDESAGPK